MISGLTRQESGTFSYLHPSINKKAISLQNGAVSLFYYQTNNPTIAALNKETAIPLTSSFQTFFR